MLIETKIDHKKFIAEVWSDDQNEPLVAEGFLEPYDEDTYVQINDWCKETFGYHARTAYHVFEFKKQAELTLFVLRWSS